MTTEVLIFRLAFYFTLSMMVQVNTLTFGQCPNVCWYQAGAVVALNVQFVFMASFLALLQHIILNLQLAIYNYTFEVIAIREFRV